MSDGERTGADERRFNLKKQFLSRAVEKGRGPWAIGMLNRLYTNAQATKAEPDEQIIERLNKWGDEEKQEIKRIILECLAKTDFQRAEDPETQALIDRELDSQKAAISVLHAMGVPQELLPEISPAIARLNAYERQRGNNPAWSPADADQQDRIEKFFLAKSTPPTNTIN